MVTSRRLTSRGLFKVQERAAILKFSSVSSSDCNTLDTPNRFSTWDMKLDAVGSLWIVNSKN